MKMPTDEASSMTGLSSACARPLTSLCSDLEESMPWMRSPTMKEWTWGRTLMPLNTLWTSCNGLLHLSTSNDDGSWNELFLLYHGHTVFDMCETVWLWGYCIMMSSILCCSFFQYCKKVKVIWGRNLLFNRKEKSDWFLSSVVVFLFYYCSYINVISNTFQILLNHGIRCRNPGAKMSCHSENVIF